MGPIELAIIGGIAVLLFGKSLPSVARNLGASYQQFRKSLSELQGELHSAAYDDRSGSSYRAPPAPRDIDDYDEATAPKFEPPPSKPEAPSLEKPEAQA